MRNTQGRTLPIFSLLFLLFTFVLNADTSTQMRARQWANQRNLITRTPAGYKSFPIFQPGIPAFAPQNVVQSAAYYEKTSVGGAPIAKNRIWTKRYRNESCTVPWHSCIHRQLQEKMTVIWHEHFAVSKCQGWVGSLMHDYEDFLIKSLMRGVLYRLKSV